MINVKIAPNGDVVMACTECPQEASVDFMLASSPFWSVHVGDALLLMMGHLGQHLAEMAPKINGDEAESGT
jgi:hypothetical protein